MAYKNVSCGSRTVQVDELDPIEQSSVDAATVVAGSVLDSRPWKSICYTAVGKTQTVVWAVFGANTATFADEVVLQSADLAAGATGSYAVAQAPYAYYRVKINSKVAGVIGSPTIYGIAK